MTQTVECEDVPASHAGPRRPILPDGREPVTAADYLFIQVGQRRQAEGPRISPSEFIDRRSTEPPRVERPPMLTVEAHAELEWLRQEREHLEAYTRKNLAHLNEQRQELEAVHGRSEARLLAREQELNRRDALLKSRAEFLRETTERCEQREAALATSEERLRNTLDRLDIESAELERLRAEAAHQAALVDRAREEHATLEASIRASREEESRWPQTREQLHQRLEELNQAEQALARRTAEAEQVEIEMRRELAHREARCAEQEAVIEVWNEGAAQAEEALALVIEARERLEAEWTEQRRATSEVV